jgi:hypothetical protein
LREAIVDCRLESLQMSYGGDDIWVERKPDVETLKKHYKQKEYDYKGIRWEWNLGNGNAWVVVGGR